MVFKCGEWKFSIWDDLLAVDWNIKVGKYPEFVLLNKINKVCKKSLILLFVSETEFLHKYLSNIQQFTWMYQLYEEMIENQPLTWRCVLKCIAITLGAWKQVFHLIPPNNCMHYFSSHWCCKWLANTKNKKQF